MTWRCLVDWIFFPLLEVSSRQLDLQNGMMITGIDCFWNKLFGCCQTWMIWVIWQWLWMGVNPIGILVLDCYNTCIPRGTVYTLSSHRFWASEDFSWLEKHDHTFWDYRWLNSPCFVYVGVYPISTEQFLLGENYSYPYVIVSRLESWVVQFLYPDLVLLWQYHIAYSSRRWWFCCHVDHF